MEGAGTRTVDLLDPAQRRKIVALHQCDEDGSICDRVRDTPLDRHRDTCSCCERRIRSDMSSFNYTGRCSLADGYSVTSFRRGHLEDAGILRVYPEDALC